MKRLFSLFGSVTIVILAVMGYYLVANQVVLRVDDQYQGLVAQAATNLSLEIKNLGSTRDGRNVTGYVIGDGPDTLLLFGAIHGNEMGTATLMNQLIAAVTADPNLVDPNKRLVIIPVANPEGYFDRTDKLNNNGVNLNLNFDTTDWEHYGPGGTYAGDEPFSEPESQIIKKVVDEYHPYAMIAFHAEGGLISPEFEESSETWSQWYAKQSGYEYFAEWDFFGTATRWFTETTHLPSVTVELGDHSSSDWEINKPVLFKLIANPGTQLPS